MVLLELESNRIVKYFKFWEPIKGGSWDCYSFGVHLFTPNEVFVLLTELHLTGVWYIHVDDCYFSIQRTPDISRSIFS